MGHTGRTGGRARFRSAGKHGLDGEQLFSYSAVALTLLVIVLSIFVHQNPWVRMEAPMQLGPVKAKLDADIYPHQASYNASVDTSSVGGGIGGGIVGTDISENGNITRMGTNHFGDSEDQKKFMDNVGLIYNSYRSRFYELEFYSWGTEKYKVRVDVFTSQVPWWVEGMKAKCWVEVSMAEKYSDVAKLVVEDISFQVWYSYNSSLNEFLDHDDIWSTSNERSVDADGGLIRIDRDIMPPTGKDLLGFTVVVKPKLVLTDGSTLTSYISPWKSTGHPVTINVYTMTTGEAAGAAMFLLANPLFMIAVALSILGGVFGLWRMKRSSAVLFFVSGAFFVISLVFFYVGFDMLTEIMAMPLSSNRDFSEYLTYQPAYYLGYVVGSMNLFAGGLMVLSRKIYGPVTKTPISHGGSGKHIGSGAHGRRRSRVVEKDAAEDAVVIEVLDQ